MSGSGYLCGLRRPTVDLKRSSVGLRGSSAGLRGLFVSQRGPYVTPKRPHVCLRVFLWYEGSTVDLKIVWRPEKAICQTEALCGQPGPTVDFKGPSVGLKGPYTVLRGPVLLPEGRCRPGNQYT